MSSGRILMREKRWQLFLVRCRNQNLLQTGTFQTLFTDLISYICIITFFIDYIVFSLKFLSKIHNTYCFFFFNLRLKNVSFKKIIIYSATFPNTVAGQLQVSLNIWLYIVHKFTRYRIRQVHLKFKIKNSIVVLYQFDSAILFFHYWLLLCSINCSSSFQKLRLLI